MYNEREKQQKKHIALEKEKEVLKAKKKERKIRKQTTFRTSILTTKKVVEQ